ncbi:hypothetical protein AURDEDRAFT_178015, partial [Auricularia subglabra TFB-10046 SS5]
GEIRSRYRADDSKRPNQKDVIARLEAEERNRFKDAGNRTTAVAMIATGVKISVLQARLKRKVAKQSGSDGSVSSDDDPSSAASASSDDEGERERPKASESVRRDRRSVAAEIEEFRVMQRAHMSCVSELMDGDEARGGEASENMEPEEEPLFLPSHFDNDSIRTEYGVPERLTKMEREIREAHAETALAELRVMISTFGGFANKAKEMLESARDKTRASNKMKRMREEQRKLVTVYNVHYNALLKLGLSKADKTYRPLTEKMLSSSSNTAKPQELGAGTGKYDEAWFWRGGLNLPERSHLDSSKIAEYTDDENRVRYFRLLGHHTRWVEQHAIVGAEFGRTERHFCKMKSIWQELAAEFDTKAAKQGAEVASRRDAAIKDGVSEAMREPVQLKRVERQLRGSAAYARQKASFYMGLEIEAHTRRLKAAAAWDKENLWAKFEGLGEQPPAKKSRVDGNRGV